MKNSNQLIKQYILDSIDLDVYEESAETAQEAVQKVIGFVMDEADHPYNRQKLVTDQAIIADHLMGLPSYINIAFYNDEILDLGVSWGCIKTDYNEDQALTFKEGYFNRIALKLLEIAKGYGTKDLKWNN